MAKLSGAFLSPKLSSTRGPTFPCCILGCPCPEGHFCLRHNAGERCQGHHDPEPAVQEGRPVQTHRRGHEAPGRHGFQARGGVG